MKKVLFILIYSFFYNTIVLCNGIAGYAGSFLRLGSTAYSISVGGGFTAVVDQGFPGYHNPASLGFLGNRSTSVSNHLLSLDRYLVSASFSTPLQPTAGIGIGIVNAGVNNIDGRDASGSSTGSFSTDEYGILVGFSNRISNKISLGVNIKVFFQNLPFDGNLNSRGTGIDAGIIFKQSKNFDLGLSIKNINSSYTWNTSDIFIENGSTYEDSFPIEISLGLISRNEKYDIIGDYSFFRSINSNIANRIRIGGEFKPINKVFLRAGLNDFSPAVGIGLDYSLFEEDDAKIDYAFLLGSVGEGISHIFTYTLNF